MDELVGGGPELVWVAAKAALLFLTAVFALRLARRRTVGQMTTVDFVAAVGAIIGRVPNSTTTTFLEGAVTLVSVLLVHAVVTHARRWPWFARLVEHPPVLVVADGRFCEEALRRCSLTRSDVLAALRQHGVLHLADVGYLVYEPPGRFSLLRAGRAGDASEVLAPVVRASQRRP